MSRKTGLMANSTDSVSVSKPEGVRPAGRLRWIAVTAYFGLGVLPGFGRWSSGQGQEEGTCHAARAHVLLGLLVIMTGLFVALGLAWGASDPASGGWASRLLPDEWTLRVAYRRVVLVWLVFWAAGVIYAARGHKGSLPGIDPIAGRPGVVRLFRLVVQTAAVLLITAFGVGSHGLWLCRSSSATARCFLLYESMEGRLPAVLFGLGYYPMILAAARSRDLGGAALLPLNEANLSRALREGVFVFVGAHGSEAGMLLADRTLSPESVGALRGERVLRLVYLAGCHADVERWQAALSPAQVLAWDRQVGTVEHLMWIWRAGARTIRSLDNGRGDDATVPETDSGGRKP